MGKIFCLMGKSSSGKDTIYKLLLEKAELKLGRIVSYTTRPIRANEAEGEEYHFVDENRLNQLKTDGKVIECRCYNTCHGPWYYFTADDGQVEKDADYLVIGTVESFVKLRDYYGKDRVLPIYIEVEDGIRLSRALKREMKQSEPKYEEMCRRFLADQQDFSEKKLAEAGVEVRFVNEEDRNDTTELIADYIRNCR